MGKADLHIHTRVSDGMATVSQALEYVEQKIPFQREVELEIKYKAKLLPCAYKADFICFGEIVVEFKALARLTTIEEAQVINYLKATGLSRALLLNFGAPRLEYKRFVFSHDK